MQLLTGLFLLAALASGDDPQAPDVRALAANVKDYTSKFKLIEIGIPAIEPLLGQVGHDDPWIVQESKTTLRFIVANASGDAIRSGHAADVIGGSTRSGRPPSERIFATELLGELPSESSVRTLGALLEDDAVRQPALDALSRIGLPTAGDAMVARLKSAPPAVRGDILRALGRRRDTRLTAVLIGAAADPAVRLAALEAIGDSGDPAAADCLASGLGERSKWTAEEKRAAHDAILRLARARAGDGNAVRFLQSAWLGSVDDSRRVAVLEAIPSTSDESVTKLVEEAARSGSPEVKRAALRACVRVADGHLRKNASREASRLYVRVLTESDDDTALVGALSGCGRVGGSEEVAAIEKLLRHPTRRVREGAIAALADVPDDRATTALLSALDGPSSALVLEALGRRRDTAAIPAVAQLAKTGNAAAIQALGSIGDPSAASVLLASVRLEHPGAVEAYLRVAKATRAKRPDDARAMYHEILDVKPTAEALAGLETVADATSAPRVEKIVDEGAEELRAAAVRCLVAIADRLVDGKRDEAIRLYRKCLDLSAPGLEDKLRNLGEQIEITARDGRVGYWWLIGPFPSPDVASWEKPEFPEQGVDLSKTYRIGDRDVRWRSREASSTDASISLESVFDPHDDVVAYGYCQLGSKKEREVTIKCGSDDGIIVWVNGQRVHSFLGPRGLTPDEDVFKAKLEEGLNEVLVKVCQGGGGWGFCMRLEDEEGLPLKFKIQ